MNNVKEKRCQMPDKQFQLKVAVLTLRKHQADNETWLDLQPSGKIQSKIRAAFHRNAVQPQCSSSRPKSLGREIVTRKQNKDLLCYFTHHSPWQDLGTMRELEHCRVLLLFQLRPQLLHHLLLRDRGTGYAEFEARFNHTGAGECGC